ncbi:MAG: penicillin-binding transpeptidase domain-containing protein [Cyanobacteria bacterium P01_C01_bin.89]
MTQPSSSPVRTGTIDNQPPERTVGKQYQPLALVLLVTTLVLGGIGSRLAYLQIYEGDRNRSLADTNRIRLVPQAPERGKILDSRGRVLADNRLAFSLAAWPIARSPQEWRTLIPTLSRILDIPTAELYQRVESAGYRSTRLLRLARDISPQQMTALVELQSAEAGLEIIKESARVYPYGDLGRSTVGTVREAQTVDVLDDDPEKVRLGDWLGVTGVEAALNNRLKGVWGARQVEMGEKPGEEARPLAGRDSQAGETVQLTLDARVQQDAETLLRNRTGALVILHAETGKVISLVSSHQEIAAPDTEAKAEELQGFERLQDSEELQDSEGLAESAEAVTQDLSKNHSTNNHSTKAPHLALQGQVPGSLFELVTATAALESGNFTPTRSLRVRPWQRVGGVLFGDRYQSSSRNLTLQAAIQRQDPILSEALFEQVALTMGTAEAITWARKLGLGQRTGIELTPEESVPLALEQLWKQESEQERWFVGDGVNLALGRGKLQVSPLQMAVFVGLLVNGGYRVQPHLVDDATPMAARQFVGLKTSTLRSLQRGFVETPMEAAAESDSSPLGEENRDSTAEKVVNSTLPTLASRSSTVALPNGENWHWVAAYAPARSPQYIAVALVSDDTAGNGDAAGGDRSPSSGLTLAKNLVQKGLWESLDPYGANTRLELAVPKIDSPPPVDVPIPEQSLPDPTQLPAESMPNR